MSTKDKYVGKLEQFQGNDFEFVQNCDDVESLNKKYDREYERYLIEFYNNDYAVALYGIDGRGYLLSDEVYFVSNL